MTKKLTKDSIKIKKEKNIVYCINKNKEKQEKLRIKKINKRLKNMNIPDEEYEWDI